ncbi:MAG: hypothetical protein L0Y43_01090 [Methylococcaceae bacterium]|nr:hypothetical protein [Methylococcaceae bacterium]
MIENIKEPTDRAIIHAIFAKLDPVGMIISTALVFGLGLMFLTLALVVQGRSGDIPIGPHLAFLGDYLPGYRVTWSGGFLGFVYGGMIGGVVGYFISLLWNLSHYFYLALIVSRIHYFSE